MRIGDRYPLAALRNIDTKGSYMEVKIGPFKTKSDP